MAITVREPKVLDPKSHRNAAESSEQAASDSKSGGLSPAVIASSVMAASIVIVQALTMAMILVLTDVSVLAAFGLGLYCAFWLGIGFGTIFGSAAVFGREH